MLVPGIKFMTPDKCARVSTSHQLYRIHWTPTGDIGANSSCNIILSRPLTVPPELGHTSESNCRNNSPTLLGQAHFTQMWASYLHEGASPQAKTPTYCRDTSVSPNLKSPKRLSRNPKPAQQILTRLSLACMILATSSDSWSRSWLFWVRSFWPLSGRLLELTWSKLVFWKKVRII